jgi:hypothetical protein
VNFLDFIPNPLSWTSDINTIEFKTTPVISWTSSTFDVAFNLPQGNTFIALALEYVLGPLGAPSNNFRQVFYFGEWASGQTLDVFDDMFQTYQINDSSYVLRLYAYAYNSSGVVGTAISEKVFSMD